MSLFRTKNLDDMIAHSKKPGGLAKVLGPFDLVLMGIGAIVGTGIFVLTGTGALTAGPALSLSFVVAAVACCFAALCYAEFASTVPVAGSIYTYSYATLGELAAWMIGWDLLLEYGLAAAAVSVGWSGYFQSLLSGFGITLPVALTAAPGALPGVTTFINLPALVIMLLLTAMLGWGVRESARLNNIMVAIKVGVVLLFIIFGARHVQPANWQPYMPFGYHGMLSAAALVFFAFIGFDAVTSAAEEVKKPSRDLPIGIIGSLAVCAVLYVVVSAIMTGIVPYQKFLGVDHPVSLALQYAGENWIAGFVDLGAILGMTTVILVMAFGQTRIIFAMSRDGLLPKRLSTVHPRFHTPFFATWLVGIVFGLIAATIPLNILAELINIGTLAAFTMVSVAVVVLRKKRPDLPRAFRCPGVPFVPALAVILCVGLMTFLSWVTWMAFSIWLVIGLAIYFGYARRRSLLHPQQ
ncbi:putative amino acid permease YhdG [Janthinobacterium sp. HH103]|uniref:amino acid permease n=1 Tax=unclassified Janthinobacterium TaxID=2610881 RepID=UPI000873811A|nr:MULTISPECIES: amino acid permease [unclassified Janthinobacterium]OEZ52776.1 putative amino acid permease YhdG [Janthinobacterium sp. HH100]OEZ52779.1 putative amino acid permease YhdG [Janthinobacterium sp. HH100]OEZ69860.1 putative amino acid permease YhdG [Janthinobacterium sp. HH103]OEZ93207.1 putative amino acid permease YhdG [Janthinobacterium sp. HH106]PHV37134.1 amino acid permease [Janthinobacterium sp. BJB304]